MSSYTLLAGHHIYYTNRPPHVLYLQATSHIQYLQATTPFALETPTSWVAGGRRGADAGYFMPAFFFYRWSFLAPFLPVSFFHLHSFFSCLPFLPAFFHLPWFFSCSLVFNEEQFDKNSHWKRSTHTCLLCAHCVLHFYDSCLPYVSR